ncbi:MAG: hypothetical protein HGA80_05200 [Candidatus Omnitrophica bacterium]|nr:hypothetical protein [Candidatus Omnitrophota bacterium]
MGQAGWSLRFILCGALICGVSSAKAETADLAAPAELPGVTREMKNAGFWIARHPAPDRLVMNPTCIARFNSQTEAAGLITDLAQAPVRYDGLRLKGEIAKMTEDLRSRQLFQVNGLAVDEAFYASLLDNMSLGVIQSEVVVRFALVAVPADERLLPTNEPLNARAGDVDFDEVQNSGLDVGTAVMVLHATADGRWLFVKEAASAGWVESAKVVEVSREEAAGYLRRRDIAIVVAPKADIFLDRVMREYFASARMGTRLVLKNISGGVAEVLIPQRLIDGTARFRSGFIAAEDLHPGYLPYTPRTILRQAFRLLNAPYGWGDMRGEQDCSRFIAMVFATVGIQLPRNSGEQARVGYALAQFKDDTALADKQALLAEKSVGALTLLRLKGHIMLYLGQFHDRFFSIHAAWSYREPITGGGERTRVIGRVAVTDLSLGTGSTKGSLLQRVLDVRYLGK